MRTWLLSLLFLIAATAGMPRADAVAPGPGHDNQARSWGEHGMALFGGTDGLYASHLPMFHAPHDYHVVLSLRLADPAIDAAVRTRLNGHPALWTLVPEPFELARLAPNAAHPLREFTADLVEGHFERGGRTIYSHVTVDVVRTERFAPLDDSRHAGTVANYQPVGQGRTWFLVKEVTARPDFDHVVMLSAKPGPLPLAIPVTGIARPDDARLARQLPSRAKILGTVYYDTEDLQ